MEQKTSFIPKTSFTPGVQQTVYRQAGAGFIFKISVCLFLVSLAIFGGSFFYKNMIARQIDDLYLSLERAKTAFDPSLISEIERLSQNLSAAKTLVSKHRFPSHIFDFLEDSTLPEVKFSNFQYSYSKTVTNESGGVKVNLKGEVKSYIDLAKQAEIFEKSSKMASASFSDFSLTTQGNVSFFANLIFNPSILQNE